MFHMSSLVTDTWTQISSFCLYNKRCGDNLSFSSSFISLEGSDAVFKFLQVHAVVFSKFLPKVLSHKLSKLSTFFSFYILFLVYFFTSFLYLSHCQIFLRRVSIEGHCCVYKHRLPYGLLSLPDHSELHTLPLDSQACFRRNSIPLLVW